MSFTFKPLKESNVPLLFEWLALPHVAAWWRETRDWQKFQEKYSNYIDGKDVGPFLIYIEDKPVGYISWYSVAACPIRTEQYPDRTYGFDLFIADTEYLGKGYGPKIIKAFIKQEILKKNPALIITDPEITNVRAIKAYEKAGFKKAQITQGTDGTAPVAVQLMELDPHEM